MERTIYLYLTSELQDVMFSEGTEKLIERMAEDRDVDASMIICNPSEDRRKSLKAAYGEENKISEEIYDRLKDHVDQCEMDPANQSPHITDKEDHFSAAWSDYCLYVGSKVKRLLTGKEKSLEPYNRENLQIILDALKEKKLNLIDVFLRNSKDRKFKLNKLIFDTLKKKRGTVYTLPILKQDLDLVRSVMPLTVKYRTIKTKGGESEAMFLVENIIPLHIPLVDQAAKKAMDNLLKPPTLKEKPESEEKTDGAWLQVAIERLGSLQNALNEKAFLRAQGKYKNAIDGIGIFSLYHYDMRVSRKGSEIVRNFTDAFHTGVTLEQVLAPESIDDSVRLYVTRNLFEKELHVVTRELIASTEED
jgi:hypothetical protein